MKHHLGSGQVSSELLLLLYSSQPPLNGCRLNQLCLNTRNRFYYLVNLSKPHLAIFATGSNKIISPIPLFEKWGFHASTHFAPPNVQKEKAGFDNSYQQSAISRDEFKLMPSKSTLTPTVRLSSRRSPLPSRERGIGGLSRGERGN